MHNVAYIPHLDMLYVGLNEFLLSFTVTNALAAIRLYIMTYIDAYDSEHSFHVNVGL